MILISCNNKVNTTDGSTSVPVKEFPFTAITMLQGSWHNYSKDGNAYEIWEKANDSSLYAKNFSIKDNDTIFNEIITIEKRNGEIQYRPSVKDGPEIIKALFILEEANNNKLVFKKNEDVFPQNISYTRIGNDSLLIEVSGQQGSSHRSEKLMMIRGISEQK